MKIESVDKSQYHLLHPPLLIRGVTVPPTPNLSIVMDIATKQAKVKEFVDQFKESDPILASDDLKSFGDKLKDREANFTLVNYRKIGGWIIGKFKEEKTGLCVESILGQEGKTSDTDLNSMKGQTFKLMFLGFNTRNNREYVRFQVSL